MYDYREYHASREQVEEWRWDAKLLLYSLVFLVIAIIAWAINYPEGWQEEAFRSGMRWGAITPLGLLIYLALCWLDDRSDFMGREDVGCLVGFLVFFLGMAMIVLGPIAGIVLLLRGHPEIFLLGFILSISGGVGLIEAVKNSYALYRDVT